MNTIYKSILLMSTIWLVGCAGTAKVEYRTKNTPVYPPQSLLIVYNVPIPPVTSNEYSEQPFDLKEEQLVNYIFELLNVISKDRKDKEALIKWSETIQTELKNLNIED